MTKLINFLKGKKTYLVAIAIAIVTGLYHIGIQVPAYVLPLLGAMGLGTLRDAISKLGK